MTEFEENIIKARDPGNISTPDKFSIWCGKKIGINRFTVDDYKSRRAMFNDALFFVKDFCEISYDLAEKYVKLNITGYYNHEKTKWVESQEAERRQIEIAASRDFFNGNPAELDGEKNRGGLRGTF
jgi:hypothetical protein